MSLESSKMMRFFGSCLRMFPRKPALCWRLRCRVFQGSVLETTPCGRDRKEVGWAEGEVGLLWSLERPSWVPQRVHSFYKHCSLPALCLAVYDTLWETEGKAVIQVRLDREPDRRVPWLRTKEESSDKLMGWSFDRKRRFLYAVSLILYNTGSIHWTLDTGWVHYCYFH